MHLAGFFNKRGNLLNAILQMSNLCRPRSLRLEEGQVRLVRGVFRAK